MASVTYDPDANALYVKVAQGRVTNTIPLGKGWHLDVSGDGKAIGMEIIFPKSTPQEAIDAIINSGKTGKAIELLTS